jgi:hypothetical protein
MRIRDARRKIDIARSASPPVVMAFRFRYFRAVIIDIRTYDRRPRIVADSLARAGDRPRGFRMARD